MNNINLTKVEKHKLANQHILATELLAWHGGQGSGLYAVGSCMLSACANGKMYSPADYSGHDNTILRAIDELRHIAGSRAPLAYSAKARKDCARLAGKLESLATSTR